MATVKKSEIEKAINEVVQYLSQYDIDPNDFKNSKGRLKSFKEFIYEKKVNEVMDKLLKGDYKEYIVETVIFEDNEQNSFLEQKLILEWEQYKKIPKTNLTILL
jgi:DNA replicative helicase MCM subunit Mcm2 (Cdc46/Mcm family)